ncbi:regulatory protein [Actinoplanes derwentensis]|uniref:Regulatory protein RecX n=1 Tax=Actinoplanes derwentensis TaxID=113562 RepID=A0A1H2D5B5_9ACTN|nr:regulatory protein [Actinoplanes derwentensis]
MSAGDDPDEPRRAGPRRGHSGRSSWGSPARSDDSGFSSSDDGSSDAGGSSGAGGSSSTRRFSGGGGSSSDDGSSADSGFPADGGSPGGGGSPFGRGRGAASRNEPPRSESEVAREICLRQLAVRPRTRAELAKVLIRKEISEEVIAEVLDRYDEVGIIDDAAFARAWVSSRHHGRGLARRALANELRQRGVDAEVADEALEVVDEEAEADAARALVDRKLRTARGAPDAVFRRLVAMLARKGYPAGIAIRAVKDALAARDAEAAEFADAIDPDALADEATGI